jgi:hypothetical protein
MNKLFHIRIDRTNFSKKICAWNIFIPFGKKIAISESTGKINGFDLYGLRIGWGESGDPFNLSGKDLLSSTEWHDKWSSITDSTADDNWYIMKKTLKGKSNFRQFLEDGMLKIGAWKDENN